MPSHKLNARIVAGLKAPDPSGKQVLHWDKELKGFAVLCSGVSNARTYIVQRDLPNGRTRRVTVGAVNEIELVTARARAADMLDSLRRGVDPKQQQKGNITLAAALAAYLLARKTLRPASVRAYTIMVEKYLTAWRELPLASITPSMVEERHRSIVSELTAEGKAGMVTANMTMRILRILYNFQAEQVPELPPNPVRLRRQWYEEKRRERIVTVDDLPRFYQAVNSLPNPIARDFILLLLFTGLRVGETSALRWEEVDWRNGIIHIPAERTKSKRKLDLPMSDFVRDLLVARRAVGNTAGWVFTAPSKSKHIKDGQHPFRLIANVSGIKVSAHDLRRTFITVAHSTGISPIALKMLVNHSTGRDVTAGYVIMSTDQLREPAQRICDRLKVLCGVVGPAGKTVVLLKG
jgi:integrase